VPLKAETEAEIKAIVLAQPHRRGDSPEDPHNATHALKLIAEGKLTKRGVEPWQFETAVKRYMLVLSRRRRVEMSRRPLAVTEGGSGRDLDEDQALEWTRDWNECRIVLRDCGEPVVKAIQYLIEDYQPEGWVPPFHVVHNATIGLAALAAHFGIVR
jgi:hypothetical protein